MRHRRKFSRQRGSHTHGGGAKKKRRGAGSRGGRGMAGTGAKGDAKKPCIWKDKDYFGKHGFFKFNAPVVKAVNLHFFEQHLDKLVAQGFVEKKGDVFIIDVKKIGFSKVLGYGQLSKKLQITAGSFSKKAEQRIKDAGGKVIVLKPTVAKTVVKPVEDDEIREKEDS